MATFAHARGQGFSKMGSYCLASSPARVRESQVRNWIASWMKTKEGFFAECNWGKNSVPTILGEEDVKTACSRWWMGHGPKKGWVPLSSYSSFSLALLAGRLAARIVDFHKWLVGTAEEPGFLHSLDLPYDKKTYSEETLQL